MMGWVSDLCQKFETLCVEVDGVIQEDPFRYVEHQLQAVGGNIENQLHTMGANMKQLCSDFVHDMLPAISPESIKGAAPELSPQQNKTIDITYSKEVLEGEISGPLSKQKTGETVEKLHLSVMEISELEKPLPTEIPEVDDTAEEDSSMISKSCLLQKSNGVGLDDQVYLSTPISLEGYNSCVKKGKTTSSVNAATDTSNEMPSSNAFILIEASQCRASDIGFTPGDTFPAVSNVTDSCWAEFKLSNEIAEESEDYVSVAYSEGSDYVNAEKSTDDYVIESGVETTQICEPKLDEKLCSVCLSAAKFRICKNITCEACAVKMNSAKEQECGEGPGNEDLDATLNQWEAECLELTVNVENGNHGACDSDWEII